MPDYPEKQFFHMLKEFIESLQEAFPKEHYLSEIKIKRNTRNIREIVSLMKPHYDAIANRDEKLFASPAVLLPNVDISVIYKYPDISTETKGAIWQYLQGLLLLGKVITDSDSDSLATLGSLIKSSGKKQKLTEEKPDSNAPPKFEDFLPKKNSIIEGLFNDMMKEMDLTDLSEFVQNINPAEILNSFMSGSLDKNSTLGIKLGQIQKCYESFAQKIKNGEIDEKVLKKEIEELIQNVVKTSKDQPNVPDLSPLADTLLNIINKGEMPSAEDLMNLAKEFMPKIIQMTKSIDPNVPDLSQYMELATSIISQKQGDGVNSMGLLNSMRNMMGGGEEEFPDLADIRQKAHKEERNKYRADAQDYRAKMKKEALQKKLMSDRASRQLKIKESADQSSKTN